MEAENTGLRLQVSEAEKLLAHSRHSRKEKVDALRAEIAYTKVRVCTSYSGVIC